jgi:hypothetical protein
VTWCATSAPPIGGDLDRLLRIGVEVLVQVDPPRLDERLFHFDVVVLGPDVEPQLLTALMRTQPQALRLPISAFEEWGAASSSLEQLLVGAGIAPPARAKSVVA